MDNGTQFPALKIVIQAFKMRPSDFFPSNLNQIMKLISTLSY